MARLLHFIFLSLFCTSAMAQSRVAIRGRVIGEDLLPIAGASILVNKGYFIATSDEAGNYELDLPPAKSYQLTVSFPGYKSISVTVQTEGLQEVEKEIKLPSAAEIPTVTIQQDFRTSNMQRLDARMIPFVPSPSGDFINSILATQPGVVMRNELSSAYSVRGGSYDENLVYVNDIEIYRPFLVRAGQQEGLSFINGDMVSNVSFSAGGFDAKYGDKLASVLDIQYRQPTRFAGTAMASILGGSLHLENVSKSGNTSYIAGIRYRSNAYVLGSLDTKGEYKPRFTDLQTYITQRLTSRLDLSFLGNFSSNQYNVIPQTRETELGTIQQAIRFTVFFDGQEVSHFTTGLGALDLKYTVNDDLRFKITASNFKTVESEEFDIIGQYSLDEIERDFGSDRFGKIVRNLGVGGFLNHARNKLEADVRSVNLKASLTYLNHYFQAGAGVQQDHFKDRLSEYVYIDSADYSVPQLSHVTGRLDVQEVVKARNELSSARFTGYVQDNITWINDRDEELKLNMGVRVNHWSVNGQTLISPRITGAYIPRWTREVNDTTVVDKSLVLRFSAGMYHQPPFYREMRGLDGSLNKKLNAQRSVHLVAGTDYNLLIWRRPFKLVAEVYYKFFRDLVPYELENVRLRYYATNNSKGFARGMDFKLNGEFVPGIESWASLSFLQTREDLLDDFYYEYYNKSGQLITPYIFDQVATDSVRYEPGYIPRPTDQLLSFSMFFQDEMPKFKGFKVNLNFLYATGVPFGPPSHNKYQDTLRTTAYKRVDIGFMKELIKPGTPGKGLLKHFTEAYITVEVFNLLQIHNTINYQWVSDVNGVQFAIPNYLTSRRVNLKFLVKF